MKKKVYLMLLLLAAIEGYGQTYNRRATELFYSGNNKVATEDLTGALFNLQDYTGSIHDITRALEGPGNNIWYFSLRGRARYQLHQYQSAIADFNRVIRTWSGDRQQKGDAYYLRGLSEINLGQAETGWPDLKKAVKAGIADARLFKYSGGI